MKHYMENKIKKMAWDFGKIFSLYLFASIIMSPLALAVSPPTMQDYTSVPHFIDESVKPNILIMLDNSGSMNEYVYIGEDYDSNKDYYGYFTSEHMYRYDSNKFVIDNVNGQWSGRFLNFLTMRRIDILRKVISGGKANSAQGSGAMVLNVDANNDYDDVYQHIVTMDGTDVSPYSGTYTFGVTNDGKIYVRAPGLDLFTNQTDSFLTVIQKDQELEPDDTFFQVNGEWRIGGVMQSFGNDANWGNMWFVEDEKSNTDEGGAIANPVQSVDNFANMITSLRNQPADKRTPLAESYYIAMQHFKQQEPEVDGYASQAAATNHDPFDDSEWCAKNFVLILTDGMSNSDAVLPGYLKDYADGTSPSFFLEDEDDWGYTNTNARYADGGTDFLKDVVHYARTKNLRDDVEGFTNLIPYIVFAFEEDPNARNLLREAARQGGYRRQINDNIPGLDRDGSYTGEKDGLIPDNYFEAKSGHNLEQALRDAILGMLNRAASGTAASVVTPTGRSRGEGSVIHSYFQPARSGDTLEIDMAGHLHSLWIDPWGNLRENSTNDLKLDYESDRIVEFEYVSRDEGTMAKRFQPFDPFEPDYDGDGKLVDPGFDPDDPLAVPESPSDPYFEMHDLESLFDAGEVLWRQTVESRNIFTFKEGASGNLIEFAYADGDEDIIPYLGVNDESVDSSYVSSLNRLGVDTSERAETLINYIRGIDKPGLRNRTLDVNGEEHVWKLGTIVNSTPSVVGGATGRFDITFRDASYRQYRTEVRNRETIVYVGANDGMLHAFTHGTYDNDNMEYSTVDGDELGTEVWAYIPRALLPHLKWLADPGYIHVYYADLQPRIFDAKIRNGGDDWGTFLLLGLNKGGKRIYINKDGEGQVIYPSYTLIDITEPRTPKVMWERSYEGSGLTTSVPAIFKVGEQWFAAFGSGPNDDVGKTDYDGRSDQKSKIYIIDLVTGEPYGANDWFKELSTEHAVLSSPVAYDKNINNNADGIYFGETYLYNPGQNDEAWKGKIHKIAVDVDNDFNYNPTTGSWSHSLVFDSPGPVTSRISMRSDPDDNVMLYFGTGRYMEQDDATDSNQQYLFGIKDPLYDNENSASIVSFGELFKANPIVVSDEGYVYEGGSFDDNGVYTGGSLFDRTGGKDGIEYTDTFENMVAYVRNNYQGWYRELETYGSDDLFASERIVSIPSLVGRMVAVSTFVPIDDVCEPQGENNMLAVYYQTGTGYTSHVLPEENSPGSVNRVEGDGEADITAFKFKVSKEGMPASHMTIHRGGSDRPIILLEADALGGLGDVDADFEMDKSRITGWRDR